MLPLLLQHPVINPPQNRRMLTDVVFARQTVMTADCTIECGNCASSIRHWQNYLYIAGALQLETVT